MDFLRRSVDPTFVVGRSVLEVGSLDVNGSPRKLVYPMQPSQYIGVDQVAGPGVDRIASAYHLIEEFGVDAFDLVISTEMLEHVDEWRIAVSQMKRVTKLGGHLIITARGPGFPRHDFPADYWRFTPADFARIFADMDILRLEPDMGAMPGVLLHARKPNNFKEARLGDVEVEKAP
jgi:SAM-dependent methyltransferase